MREGRLQLKRNDIGWGYYITNGVDTLNIHSGDGIEVLVGEFDKDGMGVHVVRWVQGRYEMQPTEPYEAYLILGKYFVHGEDVVLTIPTGALVRLPYRI